MQCENDVFRGDIPAAKRSLNRVFLYCSPSYAQIVRRMVAQALKIRRCIQRREFDEAEQYLGYVSERLRKAYVKVIAKKRLMANAHSHVLAQILSPHQKLMQQIASLGAPGRDIFLSDLDAESSYGNLPPFPDETEFFQTPEPVPSASTPESETELFHIPDDLTLADIYYSGPPPLIVPPDTSLADLHAGTAAGNVPSFPQAHEFESELPQEPATVPVQDSPPEYFHVPDDLELKDIFPAPIAAPSPIPLPEDLPRDTLSDQFLICIACNDVIGAEKILQQMPNSPVKLERDRAGAWAVQLYGLPAFYKALTQGNRAGAVKALEHFGGPPLAMLRRVLDQGAPFMRFAQTEAAILGAPVADPSEHIVEQADQPNEDRISSHTLVAEDKPLMDESSRLRQKRKQIHVPVARGQERKITLGSARRQELLDHIAQRSPNSSLKALVTATWKKRRTAFERFYQSLADWGDVGKAFRVLCDAEGADVSRIVIAQQLWSETLNDAILKRITGLFSRMNKLLHKEDPLIGSVICMPSGEEYRLFPAMGSLENPDPIEQAKEYFVHNELRGIQRLLFEGLWLRRNDVATTADLCEVIWQTSEVTEERKRSIVLGMSRLKDKLPASKPFSLRITPAEGIGYQVDQVYNSTEETSLERGVTGILEE